MTVPAYSRYRRVFGMSYIEIQKMPRLEFSAKFGNKFRYMSDSKFNKSIRRIARVYERGHEILEQYK